MSETESQVLLINRKGRVHLGKLRVGDGSAYILSRCRNSWYSYDHTFYDSKSAVTCKTCKKIMEKEKGNGDI